MNLISANDTMDLPTLRLLFAQAGLTLPDSLTNVDQLLTLKGQDIATPLDAYAVVDDQGNRWLHAVAMEGDIEELERLVAGGEGTLDLDVRNAKDETPMMLAARQGHAAVVALLADHGADVNAIVRSTEWSVMHEASLSGDIDTVRTLLSRDARIAQGTWIVDDPIWEPERFEQSKEIDFLEGCYRETIDRHGIKTRTELEGYPPRTKVKEFAPSGKLIKEYDEKADEGFIDEDYRRYTGRIVRCSPLIPACLKGEIELAQLLIEAGDDPQQVTDQGANVLHFCAANNPKLCAWFLDEHQVKPIASGWFWESPICYVQEPYLLSRFVDHGADIEASDRFQDTVLLANCKRGGNAAIILHALNLGADIYYPKAKSDDEWSYPLQEFLMSLLHLKQPCVHSILEKSAWDVRDLNSELVEAVIRAFLERGVSKKDFIAHQVRRWLKFREISAPSLKSLANQISHPIKECVIQ